MLVGLRSAPNNAYKQYDCHSLIEMGDDPAALEDAKRFQGILMLA